MTMYVETAILLSICIPTYNRCKYLSSLTEEVCKQIVEKSFQNEIELIITDNASVDNTREICETLAQTHGFCRYIRNDYNIGGEPNQLKSFELARGTYVWVLGDDDRLHEDTIDRVVSNLRDGPVQLFLNCRVFDKSGIRFSTRLQPETPPFMETEQFVTSVGLVTLFALISSHVFLRRPVAEIANKQLLLISPWYTLSIALLVAFHAKPIKIVNKPVFDYLVDNDRLDFEPVRYQRSLKLIETFDWLEQSGHVSLNFLMNCLETANNFDARTQLLREETYYSLEEITRSWAMPGQRDYKLIKRLVLREDHPGYWPIRDHLNYGYYHFDVGYEYYIEQHKKPIIHFWHGRAWTPQLHIVFASTIPEEIAQYESFLTAWPRQFPSEAILVSSTADPEDLGSGIDVFLSPPADATSLASHLNVGFRKALADQAFYLERCNASVAAQVAALLERWIAEENSSTRLIFARADLRELVGLYVGRKALLEIGGFECDQPTLSRLQEIADIALQLQASFVALDGTVSREDEQNWFDQCLPKRLIASRAAGIQTISIHPLVLSMRASAGLKEPLTLRNSGTVWPRKHLGRFLGRAERPSTQARERGRVSNNLLNEPAFASSLQGWDAFSSEAVQVTWEADNNRMGSSLTLRKSCGPHNYTGISGQPIAVRAGMTLIMSADLAEVGVQIGKLRLDLEWLDGDGRSRGFSNFLEAKEKPSSNGEKLAFARYQQTLRVPAKVKYIKFRVCAVWLKLGRNGWVSVANPVVEVRNRSALLRRQQ